jgi:hypothetical protein
MSSTVNANDGTMLPLDSLPTVLTYDGAFVATMSVVYSNNLGVEKTYTQTFTNDGTNITDISGWEVQP